jgi:processing peptidase subunit beta
MFKIMTDCSLEPRSVVAANIALEKNNNVHNIEKAIHSGESFNETIFKTSFGL